MFFCECAHCYRAQNVALHAESVDRKDNVICKEISRDVALHAESVDRNVRCNILNRHAIIVALHAESVDRNLTGYGGSNKSDGSVALHAESVDRNLEKST